MLSVVNRKPTKPRGLPDWATEAAACWVLNQNVLASKRLFLEGRLLQTPESPNAEVAVAVQTENQKAEISVPFELVFERLEGKFGDDDLAKIPVNNHAEIFRFLNERLVRQRRYFECGVDLFFLNDFALSDPNSPTPDVAATERKQIKEALNWLFDENSLKPSGANAFAFMAGLLKSYWWTLEPQTALLCGEQQSGKSANFSKLLDFIGEYNLSAVEPVALESVRARNISARERLSRLESFIHEKPSELSRVPEPAKSSTAQFDQLPLEKPSLGQKDSLFSFNHDGRPEQPSRTELRQNQKSTVQKLSIPSFNTVKSKTKGKQSTAEVQRSLSRGTSKAKESVISAKGPAQVRGESKSRGPSLDRSAQQKPAPNVRAVIYESFRTELWHAKTAIEPLTRHLHRNGVTGSSAAVVLKLEADDRLKFVGFNFKVRLLRTHELVSHVI